MTAACFQEAGNRVVPEGDGPYLVEPRSTYAYIPGHPVPQVDSEFPIGQFLCHHPLKWVGKLCLSPTCLGLFSSHLLETKQVVAIWGAHAELQLIVFPRATAKVMSWVLRSAGLVCRCCAGMASLPSVKVDCPVSLMGGLCASPQERGPPALGPEASLTPSWNSRGWGLLIVPHGWKELGSMCFSSYLQREGEKGRAGGSLRPAAWDQLTSPVPLPRRTRIVFSILTLHGFLRPEHLVGGSGAPPPKQAHTVGL